ncbi:erythromycin esterase family protein [bacterium SCSIO 12643]|nr:erythromycin esterase family protein [bacterium SCSIO 12643]
MKSVLVFVVFIHLTIQAFSQIYVDTLVNQMYKISDCDSHLIYSEIAKIVKDKRIVILGEAGHGDGGVFELKSGLIKYLVENHGFNTVALEGAGFFDFQYIQNNVPEVEGIQRAYLGWAPMWKDAKETSVLNKLIEEGKVKAFGMDSEISYGASLLPYYLSKMYSFDGIDMDKLYKLNRRLYRQDSTLSAEDYRMIDSSYIEIKKRLDTMTIAMDVKEILLQSVDNALALSEEYHIVFIDKDMRDYGINTRDQQMANNIMWFLERNPNAKMIIWTASFHGATKIKDIVYDEEDPKLYDLYVTLGEHLKEKYKEGVYSIAYTSGGGVAGMYLTGQEFPVDPFEETLESQLYQKPICFGFLNFNGLNLSESKQYQSILMGYRLKKGIWQNAFDGIFYLRTNHATSRRK